MEEEVGEVSSEYCVTWGKIGERRENQTIN
jgi:hypothetical protein